MGRTFRLKSLQERFLRKTFSEESKRKTIEREEVLEIQDEQMLLRKIIPEPDEKVTYIETHPGRTQFVILQTNKRRNYIVSNLRLLYDYLASGQNPDGVDELLFTKPILGEWKHSYNSDYHGEYKIPVQTISGKVWTDVQNIRTSVIDYDSLLDRLERELFGKKDVLTGKLLFFPKHIWGPQVNIKTTDGWLTIPVCDMVEYLKTQEGDLEHEEKIVDNIYWAYSSMGSGWSGKYTRLGLKYGWLEPERNPGWYKAGCPTVADSITLVQEYLSHV